MIEKLENPIRIAELNPLSTLKEIGLTENNVFCDVGAGSGIFSFAAAEYTKNTIYAVDTSPTMLSILEDKKNSQKASNVTILNSIQKVPDSSCDLLLLCTVLHEIDDKAPFLLELKRILKREGHVGIIEFHKKETPFGPPISKRLSVNDVIDIFKNMDSIVIKDFSLGENFYCLVFSFQTK